MSRYEELLVDALEEMSTSVNVSQKEYSEFRRFVRKEINEKVWERWVHSDTDLSCRSERTFEQILDRTETAMIMDDAVEYDTAQPFFGFMYALPRRIEEKLHNTDHYAGDGTIRCEDACRSMMSHSKESSMVSHWWGLAHKYVWRWHLKNRVSDIDKAIDCLQKMKAQLEYEGEM